MPTLDWIGKKAVANFQSKAPFHLLAGSGTTGHAVLNLGISKKLWKH